MFATTQIFSLFSATHEQLEQFYDDPDVIVIASPGRSGSTMLTFLIEEFCQDRIVIKTHLLPPNSNFKGKILFIFSNPDKAAESVLHLTMTCFGFGEAHFFHLETSDKLWLSQIKDPRHQTLEFNLLAEDALGCAQQLNAWLHLYTEPTTLDSAQVLSVKYENLWEPATVNAIMDFLNLQTFTLPVYTPRGYGTDKLLPEEILFRTVYNLGTPDNPRYSAYDRARLFWEIAPPYQFLRLKPDLTPQL